MIFRHLEDVFFIRYSWGINEVLFSYLIIFLASKIKDIISLFSKEEIDITPASSASGLSNEFLIVIAGNFKIAASSLIEQLSLITQKAFFSNAK